MEWIADYGWAPLTLAGLVYIALTPLRASTTETIQGDEEERSTDSRISIRPEGVWTNEARLIVKNLGPTATFVANAELVGIDQRGMSRIGRQFKPTWTHSDSALDAEIPTGDTRTLVLVSYKRGFNDLLHMNENNVYVPEASGKTHVASRVWWTESLDVLIDPEKKPPFTPELSDPPTLLFRLRIGPISGKQRAENLLVACRQEWPPLKLTRATGSDVRRFKQ